MSLKMQLGEHVARLRAASAAYYKDGSSQMSDEEFDHNLEKLREVDPGNSFLAEVGSPPATVGRNKIRHTIPMLSLNKATTKKELESFLTQSGFQTKVVVEHKLDGASIEAYYKGGVLQWAATRGDGLTGEDVTVAARNIKGLPATTHLTHDLWVRGEVFLSKENWALVDPAMKTNPRNVGTGILNRLDGSDSDKLSFLAYSALGLNIDSHYDSQRALSLAGFGVAVTELIFNASADDVLCIIERMRVERPNLYYAIDGAVVKFDSATTRDILGESSGRPRGQTAFKWKSETIETIIKGVTLTVGHTGYIAPTAQLEPVQLMGVTVSNALLNNWDEIKRLDVAIGDTVIVERSGEIIPKIIGVVERPPWRQGILEPIYCPECGGSCSRRGAAEALDIAVPEELRPDFEANPEQALKDLAGVSAEGLAQGALTYCNNDDCPAKQRGRIKRWIKSNNILGVGDDLLDSLFKSGLVTTIERLYTVTPIELASTRLGNGVLGQKRAESLVREISKTMGALALTQFVGSLGVPFLGVRKATIMRKLAGGKLDTLDAWLGSTLVEVGPQVQAGGTTPVMSAYLTTHRQAVERLAAFTLKPQEDDQEDAPQTQGLAALPDSKCFLLTGKFEQKKSYYHDLITSHGHRFAEDFTKDVTHLVQADPSSQSSKTKKAVKAGIPVISDTDLLSMLS